jgi:tetratricopeptide (TPR) repeat protein
MPEKSSARKKMSRAELRALDVQIDFIEGVVRRDPGYVDALQLLGDNYTKRGRFAEGLVVDERLARLEPKNPLVFYNLACSYSLTDQFDLAIKSLKKALKLGYRDFKWLARDPDLRKLRKHPAYKDIAEALRQFKNSQTGTA